MISSGWLTPKLAGVDHRKASKQVTRFAANAGDDDLVVMLVVVLLAREGDGARLTRHCLGLER